MCLGVRSRQLNSDSGLVFWDYRIKEANDVDSPFQQHVCHGLREFCIVQHHGYDGRVAIDDVEVVFTDEALEAVALEAMRHKTGARGLRTIVEGTLLDAMYEIPGREDVVKCVVNAENIRQGTRPLLLNAQGKAVQWSDEQLAASA